MNQDYGFTEAEWETCLKVLKVLKEDPFNNPDNEVFGALITKIHKTAKKHRKQDPSLKKAADLALLQKTGIAKQALNNTTQYRAEVSQEETSYASLNYSKNCYSCNQPYSLVHSFYHRLCPTCAELNYARRFFKVDLSDRKVILTGGRVKIGYATALKLLRDGADLTLTTRFPALALEQFEAEQDYALWKDRLDIYGLDLRNLHAVQEFIQYYKSKHHRLDILINNAAQTIKYDQQYYSPLIQKELALSAQHTDRLGFSPNKTPILGQVNALEAPTDLSLAEKTRFGQPVDRREKNSWNSTLTEVELPEVLEVNLINHISPYYLIKELTPLLKASSFPERFIINVTSSEGQFSYTNKTIFHPHTNMTKAALNMLTRTSGSEYAKSGIYMSSVDVGWVSTGAIESLRKKQFDQGYIPPLDPVDGAARILHPIEVALEDKNYFSGCLLKNYEIVDW